MTRLELRNKSIVLFTSLGLGLLLVISVFSYWSGKRYLESSEWRAHSEDVMITLNELQALSERAETTQRGFIITQQNSFLEPFNKTAAEAKELSKSLKLKVMDNKEQSKRAEELDDLLERRIERLKFAIDLASNGQVKAMVELIKTGLSKNLMDKLREKFEEMRKHEIGLLKERTQKSYDDFKNATAIIAIGLISSFLLMSAVTLLLRREIQRRERIERHLKEAESQAKTASELKSQFLANMSHEIRTPLNGIIGVTQIFDKANLSQEQSELLKTLEESSGTLLLLINQILDLSKIESGKLELEERHFEFRSFVSKTLSIIEANAKVKGLTVETQIEDGVPDKLLGDALRVRQVLLNLINNAIKFTREGSIVLRVRKSYDDGSTVRLMTEVIDSGIGMNDDALGKLFKAFSQGDDSTTRRYGGTGLGLAISKQLVEAMRGHIGVESTPGKGSRFFFEVELKHSKYESQANSATMGDETLGKINARILVADDNLTNQKIVAAMLKQLGCTSALVFDGQEAIEALQANDYDLVLMDGQMPRLDGFEATKLIRSGTQKVRNKDIPVLAVTASAIKGDVEKCLRAGMNDYIAKPVSLNDLDRKIRKWLNVGSNSIDEKAIARVREIDSEDSSLLKELISLFKSSTPEAITSMRNAASQGQTEALNAQAHHFKSSCANIGAIRMRDIASRLEKAKPASDAQEIDDLLTALEVEYRSVQEELKKYEAA